MRDRRMRRESSGRYPLYSFPARPHTLALKTMKFTALGASCLEAVALSWFWELLSLVPSVPSGGGKGHEGGERMLEQIPTVTGSKFLPQPC